MGIGPTFDELLEVVQKYLETRVRAIEASDIRDVGICFWRQRVLNILETAIREAGVAGVRAVPIPGAPEYLDTELLRRFQWTGIVAEGKKCHTNKVPCHTDLEKQFADFLDGAGDVIRYVKNERFGFSVTYYENNRPRQYYPDFIVVVREKGGREVLWLVETKGEVRHNTALKREATQLWCEKMSGTSYGTWRHLFVQQRKFEAAISAKVRTFPELVDALVVGRRETTVRLLRFAERRIPPGAFKTLLPLYSLRAAAGYFGGREAVEPEGWVGAEEIGKLDEQMFVARVVGRSMEPRIYDGDYCVFRARPTGTRHGKIVLAQYRGPADPETGGSFIVKRYSSEKVADPEGGWRHTKVALSPLNPEFQPIVLTPDSEDDIQIIAEWLTVLGRA